ncbi:MAG: hypothetical protein RR500_09680 [Bacilli bacterium]
MKKVLKGLILASVIIAGIGVVGCASQPEDAKEETNVEKQANEEQTTKEEPKKEKVQYSVKLEGGMYKEGTDFPAGDYFLVKSDDGFMGSYEITNDTTGEISAIYDKNAFYETAIIRVPEGKYLKLKDCTAVPKEEAYNILLKDKKYLYEGSIPAGMEYEVGKLIPAGEYKLIAADGKNGWYSLNGSLERYDLITSDTFEGFEYITLKDGQFIKLDNNTSLEISE